MGQVKNDGGGTEDSWTKLLKSRYEDGERDAEKGIFRPPYPSTGDPQAEAENYEYEKGFHDKRAKLGSKFQWQ